MIKNKKKIQRQTKKINPFFVLFILFFLLFPIFYYFYKKINWDKFETHEQKIEEIIQNQKTIISDSDMINTAEQASRIIIEFTNELKNYKIVLKEINKKEKNSNNNNNNININKLKNLKEKVSSNILLFVDSKAMDKFNKDKVVQKATDELIENMWFLKNK